MIDCILKDTGQDQAGVDKLKFGILYDIGCNLEKSIVKVWNHIISIYSYSTESWLGIKSFWKRNFFSRARENRQLKFGTSVFHSYVHQWSCQLEYNPRLNEDWGLSDGEGLERIWSKLAPLVGALRYSTAFHRLCALELKTRHINEAARKVSGMSFFFLWAFEIKSNINFVRIWNQF